jgi:hypothetical protein
MAKGEASVESLVEMIEQGQLRLPEMQRGYVWRAPRVRDLLDSLYRGYPSGAILLWQTTDKIRGRRFSIGQKANPFQHSLLLLDGQQRLTSLSAVIRGEPVIVRNRRKPIDILFNLEHPDKLEIVTEVHEDGGPGEEEGVDLYGDESDSTAADLQARLDRMTFVVSTRKLARLSHWVSVTEVFKTDEDAPFLQRAGITSFSDPRYKKYSQRLAKLRGIKKYSYRMDILEQSLTYDEVTEIFVRVNSLGAKLRSSDLALAQITAKWPGALAEFQAFQKKCDKAGFDLDQAIHLKNMVAFASGQSRFATVGGMSVQRLKKAWKESIPGMEFSLNFLRSNAGIDSPVLLSSPFLVVTLGYYGHCRGYRIRGREAEKLRQWLLMANAKGRYSRGSSETLLDQDLATLRKGGAADELIERLRGQVGRLDVTPEELAGKTQQSALFKTMFLAFREAGAKDWVSNLAISLDHAGSRDRLQFHHIFPKALLKKHGYQPREADDIANLAFIGGKTNRQISASPPEKYFPKLTGGTRSRKLKAQCIPTDKRLLGVDAYKEFLAARRELVSRRLNQFLGVG